MATSDSIDDDIRRAPAKAMSNREIATIIGCHHNTVAAHLKKMGLDANFPRGRPPEAVDGGYRCREVQAAGVGSGWSERV